MKCTNEEESKAEQRNVLVRAYGRKSELVIDRNAELINFVSLSRVGLSPPLFARFNNGFVYGFVEGRVFSLDDMGETHKASLVARKVAQWHRLSFNTGNDSHGDLGGNNNEARLFPTLWKWWNGIPVGYDVPETQERFLKSIDGEFLRQQIVLLERILTPLRSPVVFCHNDLLSANIIYQPQKDDVAFIDFEYGCLNYRGFDIANHFCEWAGFECDYNRYPSKKQQAAWLRAYWKEYYPNGNDPTEEQIIELMREVSLFSLASHMYWGLWGLVQASFSDIPFDYMGYAIKRFTRYIQTVPTLLSRDEQLPPSSALG